MNARGNLIFTSHGLTGGTESGALAPDGEMPAGLEQVVTGEANREACQAVRVFLQDESGKGCLLWLHGPTGSGKTYLIRAMASEICRNGGSVCRMTGEELAQELVRNVRAHLDGEPEIWPEGWEDAETLLLEEEGCFVGKEATQERVAALLSDWMEKGKRIVMTSPAGAAETSLREELRRRGNKVTEAKLDPPDFPMKKEMLEQMARERRVSLTEAEKDRMAAEAENAARLRGLLTQKQAKARGEGE